MMRLLKMLNPKLPLILCYIYDSRPEPEWEILEISLSLPGLMDPSTPSVALPWPRTPLSLPSWPSPSLRVRTSSDSHSSSLSTLPDLCVSLHPQTLLQLLTGCCPPTTTTTPWSTAAPTSASCTWSSPGSWAGSPPCPRRPWRSCAASCPPSESKWTSCSPPTRTPLSAAPWSSKMDRGRAWTSPQAAKCKSVCLMQRQCNKPVETTVLSPFFRPLWHLMWGTSDNRLAPVLFWFNISISWFNFRLVSLWVCVLTAEISANTQFHATFQLQTNLSLSLTINTCCYTVTAFASSEHILHFTVNPVWGLAKC